MTAARSFPRPARLLLPPEFKRCFESGQRLSGRYFRVHVACAEQPRLGLAVSRKVSRRAVERNRIKRVVRESFRHHRQRLPALDLVILAKREAATADNPTLRSDLASLWRRLPSLLRAGAAGTMRADSTGHASCPAPSSSAACDDPSLVDTSAAAQARSPHSD